MMSGKNSVVSEEALDIFNNMQKDLLDFMEEELEELLKETAKKENEEAYKRAMKGIYCYA